MRRRGRTSFVIAVVIAAGVAAPVPAASAFDSHPPAAVVAVVDAGAASDPVYRFYSPAGRTHFFTASPTERDRLSSEGSGWRYEGIAYLASVSPVTGTVPLYRLWNAQKRSHLYTTDARERDSIIARYAGTWSYEGVAYYVYPATEDSEGTLPTYRFYNPSLGRHLITMSVAERDSLARPASGWRLEGSPFRVADPSAVQSDAPPITSGRSDGDGVFTLATIPDTQQEVFSWAGDRFAARSRWLVSQRDALDLRFVAHTGDVVNWDTSDHAQFRLAEAALDPLEAAGIPYQLSIGNHDTLATGPGGAARDSRRTREYQRTTATFNAFFTAADYGAVEGAYEAGRVDNTYSRFRAEGTTWLVLNLELWPRAGALDWAERVIWSHPEDNVVIQTHSFLNTRADIDGAGQALTRWSYGDSSPQYVYNRLVAAYRNVKIVTSGHVGIAASKTVTTPVGNRVGFFLQTLHSNEDNPTRISRIDVTSGTISTRVYAPESGRVWDEETMSGFSFLQAR